MERLFLNVPSEADGPLPRNAGMEERGHRWTDGAERGRELYSSGGLLPGTGGGGVNTRESDSSLLEKSRLSPETKT